MVLQSCASLQKIVSSSCSETDLTTSHGGNQVVNIKVENVADVQDKEEDPLITEFPIIKAEHEVSFMSLCTFQGTL